jgi:hypothetical protein
LKATQRNDADIIPEVALRPSTEGETVHYGRGGEGNVAKDTPSNTEKQEGLADKLKNKLFKKKVEKKAEETPPTS